MAYPLLRLGGSAAAAGGTRHCYSFLGRNCGGIANSFDSSSNLGRHHRRMSISPSRMSPCLVLPPAFKGGDMVYRFYNLAEDRVESVTKRRRRSSEEEEFELPADESELVGSSHGWLALFNPRNNDIFLSNPFTRRHIKLPPIHTLPNPEINLTNGRGSVSKLILSCCPDEDEDECRALMTFGPGDRLAFCRPCRSTEWTPIGELFFSGYREEDWFCVMNYGMAYEDFVYCSRRKAFSCTTQLEIDLEKWCPTPPTQFEVWDLSGPPKSSSFYWHVLGFEGQKCPWLKENMELIKLCRQIPYLVYAEHYDQLFIVIRFVMERVGHNRSYVDVDSIPYDPVSDRLLIHLYPYKTIGFSVLKVDYRMGRKVRGLEVVDGLTLMDNNSLDGLAMFIGMNHSFAVSAAAELGLKPNSIYFTDSSKHPPDSIYGGHDIGIFDYENKTVSPCYYPCDVQSLRRIAPAPMWFTRTTH